MVDIVCFDWMGSRLNLKGCELLVFGLHFSNNNYRHPDDDIYGLTVDEIAEYTGLTEKEIIKVHNALYKKGLVRIEYAPDKITFYPVESKNSRTPWLAH